MAMSRALSRWRPPRPLRALAIALLALLATEGLLRLALPPPDPTAQLLTVPAGEVHRQILTTPHWPNLVMVACGRECFVERKRPAGALRIVMLGSSVVHGFLLPYFRSIPWQVERELRARMPDRQVEVLNLGIPGYTLRHQLPLVERCIEMLDPDVIVMIEGNNESSELVYRKLQIPGYDARAEYARQMLSRVALYRVLRDVMATPTLSPSKADLDRTLHERERSVQLSDRERALIRLLFRENLEGLARIAESSNRTIMVCTVPTQDTWMTDDRTWMQTPRAVAGFANADAMFGVLQTRMNDGRLEESVSILTRAIDAWDHPYFHVALGRVLRALGHPEEARRHLLIAAENDLRPVRTMPSQNAAIRGIADGRRLLLCDLEQGLRLRSQDGILDERWFMDYVHMTPEGAAMTGKMLAERLTQIVGGLPEPTGEMIADSPESLEGWIGLRWWTWERTPWMATLQRRTGLLDQVMVDIDAVHAEVPLNRASRFDLCIAGHQLFAERRYTDAAAYYEKAIERGGATLDLYRNLGYCWLWAHEFTRAADAFGKAARLSPTDPVTRRNLRALQR